MKGFTNFLATLSVLGLALTACGEATQTALPVEPTEAGLLAQPTETVPVTTATPVLATFQDTSYGFSFDYPTGWMLDEVKVGNRAASTYQITSWSHAPGLIDAIPADGTDINIVLQRWDPKGDLKAFVDMRKSAWAGSSITITSEQQLTLAGGKPAYSFVVKGSDGTPGYFLLATLGENYLVVSGSGDLEKIDQVARSLR